MSGRFWLGLAASLWGLAGPAVGFVVGQRLIGVDCQLSPTLGADMQTALTQVADLLARTVSNVSRSILTLLSLDGGLRMLTDPATWLLWLILAGLAIGSLAWWMRGRTKSSVPTPDDSAAPEPARIESRQPVTQPRRGRECKIAIGSAGIKSIVREGRIEDAYQVRSGSETAFEAYADFDRQQERVALTNRLGGPGFLVLSQTLDAHSPLSEGLGNRPPAEVWAIREEWMPGVSHFVEEAALRLRAEGVWPARIMADLSAGGHGVPGLFALLAAADEFPRADRHSRFIVPEGDVERQESIRLLDAMRTGDLVLGAHSQPMPWKGKLPLALTSLLRDNRRGREDLDEVAAHIAPALSARVRFDTSTSENLSNLMRRLIKHGPHAESEPCPLTFHYTEAAVPISGEGSRGAVDVASLLPIVDSTFRALRYEDGVRAALDADIARYLVLITAPCNSWNDVRQVEQYVLERLHFAGPPDRRRIGIFFSGYRPAATNREEPAFAIRLGTVDGGWASVYRAIGSTQHVSHNIPTGHVDRTIRDGVVRESEAVP